LLEVIEDLSPIKCSIAQCLLNLPAGEVLFGLIDERVELAPIRNSLVSDLDYKHLFLKIGAAVATAVLKSDWLGPPLHLKFTLSALIWLPSFSFYHYAIKPAKHN